MQIVVVAWWDNFPNWSLLWKKHYSELDYSIDFPQQERANWVLKEPEWLKCVCDLCTLHVVNVVEHEQPFGFILPGLIVSHVHKRCHLLCAPNTCVNQKRGNWFAAITACCAVVLLPCWKTLIVDSQHTAYYLNVPILQRHHISVNVQGEATILLSLLPNTSRGICSAGDYRDFRSFPSEFSCVSLFGFFVLPV